MIKIFRTIDGHIHQLNEASEGCWVVLANPRLQKFWKQPTNIILIRMIFGHLWMKKRDRVLRWKIITP